MKQIIGQITIYEYLSSVGAKEIMPSCFFKGQDVYFVEKDIVLPYQVYGIYNIAGEESIVLVAKQRGIIPYRHIRTEDVDTMIFSDLEEAKKKAKMYAKDVISVSDMRIKTYKAYTADNPRGSKAGKLFAFYAVLSNGFVYMKDFYSCGHLLAITEKEAAEMLNMYLDNYVLKYEETRLRPILKDMYRVKSKTSTWAYSESDCPLTQE